MKKPFVFLCLLLSVCLLCGCSSTSSEDPQSLLLRDVQIRDVQIIASPTLTVALNAAEDADGCPVLTYQVTNNTENDLGYGALFTLYRNGKPVTCHMDFPAMEYPLPAGETVTITDPLRDFALVSGKGYSLQHSFGTNGVVEFRFALESK